jgi:two-component system, chemotaxis family, chemotaxis protein CheY
MATILVIEDDPAMRRATCRILQGAGHAVTGFENGAAAIEQIEQEAPDLLITEIFMPEVEGLETIRRVRALRPAMPIVAISGFTLDGGGDYLGAAEKFGAAASLKKPFRPAELLNLVSRLLAKPPA